MFEICYTSSFLDLFIWIKSSLRIRIKIFNIQFVFSRIFYYPRPHFYSSIEYNNIRDHKYCLFDFVW